MGWVHLKISNITSSPQLLPRCCCHTNNYSFRSKLRRQKRSFLQIGKLFLTEVATNVTFNLTTPNETTFLEVRRKFWSGFEPPTTHATFFQLLKQIVVQVTYLSTIEGLYYLKTKPGTIWANFLQNLMSFVFTWPNFGIDSWPSFSLS